MRKLEEFVKNTGETLIELWIGILFLGILLQLAAAALWYFQVWNGDIAHFAAGLWFGVFMAGWLAFGMKRSLDRACTLDIKNARRSLQGSASLRYATCCIVVGILFLTERANPLACVIGMLSLKAAAYIQPLTHKFLTYIIKRR